MDWKELKDILVRIISAQQMQSCVKLASATPIRTDSSVKRAADLRLPAERIHTAGAFVQKRESKSSQCECDVVAHDSINGMHQNGSTAVIEMDG